MKRRLFAWLFERAAGRRGFDLIVGHGDTFLQDALHLHNCVHAAHEAVRGGSIPRSAGVGRIHEEMLAGRRFKLLIANSNLMAKDVQARFGVPAEAVEVVYPGHDPARFRTGDKDSWRATAREELGAGEGFLVGLVTSGDFQKRGVDAFIRIVATLPLGLREKVRGLVVGKEKDVSEYRRLARQAGIADRISFLETFPRIQRVYHALDVFVYPALYEEFGQAVQEAMACGAPVLTSRRVGAGELLEREAPGCVLDIPEPAAFTVALARLLEDKAARDSLGGACARACRANTWDENFRRTLDAYARRLQFSP